jgi:hypothetical protein
MSRSILSMFFVLLVSPQILAAPCAGTKFTPDDQIRLTHSKVLLVTHPSTIWEGRFASKAGIDASVIDAKNHGIPVVYLQSASGSQAQLNTYFYSDCRPTYVAESEDGRLGFDINATHVISVGGHWEECQRTTLEYLFATSWSKKRGVNLTLTQVMDGIFGLGDTLPADAPYKNDVLRFLEVVSYGRPKLKYQTKKITLLEMMGIIGDKNLQHQFLRSILPPFNEVAREYEVQLILNGELLEVLRKGNVANPPILKLEYINTQIDDTHIPR